MHHADNVGPIMHQGKPFCHPDHQNRLSFIVLFAKNYTNQIKSNYLNSHGEEAQEKPPGL